MLISFTLITPSIFLRDLLAPLTQLYFIGQEAGHRSMGVGPGDASIKEPPANAVDIRDLGSIIGSGRSPGGGYGNPLTILAWRIPWTKDPDRLQFIGSQKVRHD